MIGETLGSYRITEKIGAGGMGAVYKAEHTLMGTDAVIKVLHPEFSKNEQIVKRFFNEAKAAALIKHMGIVTIFDFGHREDQSAYIVMEYLPGESLGARIRKVDKLPPAEALRIIGQQQVLLVLYVQPLGS